MNIESLETIKEVSPTECVSDIAEPLKETGEPVEQLERSFTPSEFSEIVTDYEMTKGIAEKLASIPEIRYENWKNLSVEQRAEVLNRVEVCAAAIEHRPPVKVILEPMAKNDLGYHSRSKGIIALNVDLVARNDAGIYREMIETIIHEGRHAYQHYNVDVKTIHESPSEVQSWRENFYNPKYQYYQSGHQRVPIRMPDGSLQNADYRLYYYQPVEIDARNFASEVISKLEAQGVMGHEQNQREEQMNMAENDYHNEIGNETQDANSIDETSSKHSPFESGFDAEHPIPTYEQLRNAGFSPKIASSIAYNTQHVYSQRELFHCLYESDDPLKAYNEMMDAKAKDLIKKTEAFLQQFGV